MACSISTESSPPTSNGTVKKVQENGDVRNARTNPERVPSIRVIEEGNSSSHHGVLRNGNAKPHRKKSVTLKPMAAIEEDEIRPPPSKCCCDHISVQTACRLVAFLSLIASIANAALYCLGLSRMGLGAAAEIIIMILDFVAAICLLIGATNGSPAMLKPYLFFMAAWSFGLILLLLSCLWKLLTTRNFANNTIHNLMDINRTGEGSRVRHVRHGQEGWEIIITFVIVAALGLIIFIDCVFLHVAYRAFQFFAYKKDRAKEGRTPI